MPLSHVWVWETNFKEASVVLSENVFDLMRSVQPTQEEGKASLLEIFLGGENVRQILAGSWVLTPDIVVKCCCSILHQGYHLGKYLVFLWWDSSIRSGFRVSTFVTMNPKAVGAWENLANSGHVCDFQKPFIILTPSWFIHNQAGRVVLPSIRQSGESLFRKCLAVISFEADASCIESGRRSRYQIAWIGQCDLKAITIITGVEITH